MVTKETSQKRAEKISVESDANSEKRDGQKASGLEKFKKC